MHYLMQSEIVQILSQVKKRFIMLKQTSILHNDGTLQQSMM